MVDIPLKILTVTSNCFREGNVYHLVFHLGRVLDRSGAGGVIVSSRLLRYY